VRLKSGGLELKVSPGKTFVKFHLNGKKLGMVASTCYLSDSGISSVQARSGESETLSPKEPE
jgi:hypothetical protein